MRKLNITLSMWEVVTIAFLCLAIAGMVSSLLGDGEGSYLVATSIATALMCMPTRKEYERATQ